MPSLNYFRILLVVTSFAILISLAEVMPVFASPYALQNPAGTVNATNATSGNTSPTSPSNSGVITITTDKTSYNDGDTITISGNTQVYTTNTPIIVIVKSPVGNIVKFDSIPLYSDRTYSTSLKATGPLWQAAGTYTVVVQYGSASSTAQTTFQFTGSAGGQQGQAGNTMQATGTDLSVQYGITNGKLLDIISNVQSNSLIFSTQTTGDGVLTVTLPRILIDARMNDQTDEKFRVLNNGQENLNFQETSETTTDRTLSIPFTDGTTEIEIIGTDLVGRVSGNGPQQQIQTTSGGTLQVGLLIEPLYPNTSSQTQLNINFINKQTNAVQPSIDYKITVMQGGNQVFVIPVTHTVQGTVTIPIQFHNAGTYQIIVEVDGMVFQPIPPETATFSISVTGQTASTLPSSPTNLVATPVSSSEVDLSWTAPQNNGGLQITGYKIERNDGNGFNVIANSPTTSYQDKNLVPNPEHSYRVSAINSAGSSVSSNIAPVIMPSSTPAPTQSNIQNTTTSSDQNPNQSLSDILKQRYEAARKLQEMLNGQAGANIAIPQGAGASASADCVTTNNCFSPNPLNVAPGTTITWTNNDQVSHTITSGKVSDSNAGSLFDSGLVKPGNTFQFTFATAGTVNYFCTVHPWMIGQVIVGGMEGHHEYENESQQIQHEREHNNYGIINPTQQDIQNINQAKTNQTIAAEVNFGGNQSQTTSIDNNVSVKTTQNTPDSLGVQVTATNQTGPKVIVFNLNATTINLQNLKDLGVMYDGKLIQPAPNMDAILHAKPTDNPSFAIVVTQSGIQVLVLVPHFSTHSITITNMSKIMTTTIPEFPFATIILIIATFSIVLIPKVRQFQKL